MTTDLYSRVQHTRDLSYYALIFLICACGSKFSSYTVEPDSWWDKISEISVCRKKLSSTSETQNKRAINNIISETSEAYLGKVMIVSDFMETVVRNGGV